MSSITNYEMANARQRKIDEEFVWMSRRNGNEEETPWLSPAPRLILGLGSILLGLLFFAQSFYR